MADKSIFSLDTQTEFGAQDRLVIGNYANNDARAITGAAMVAQLTHLADGHGGIASIQMTGTEGTNPVINTYTITYADGSTSTFDVTNGVKGDTGAQTFVWFRYDHVNPSVWSDTTSTPDDWIGIATGTGIQPTTVSSYTWFKFKGEKGDTGDAAEVVSQSVSYQVSDSGTTIPSGTWTPTVPSVPQGGYLWTRTIVTFNDNTSVTSYSVGRMGVDGTGTGTVQSVSYNGNVYNQVVDGDLALGDIQAQHSTVDVTINVSDWNNGTCTKTVNGVTSSNTIVVAPTPASADAYGGADVKATAQTTNAVTFTCEEVPTASLSVYVVILD